MFVIDKGPNKGPYWLENVQDLNPTARPWSLAEPG